MKTNNYYVWEKEISLNDLVLKQKEEIERLNNIINELEYQLKFQRKCCLGLDNKFGVSLCDILLNNLQELKGVDKK